MKRSIIATIALIALLAAPMVAHSALKAKPKATVNWAKGVYSASATAPVSGKGTPQQIAAAKDTAMAGAVNAIIASLETTAVDSFHLGKDLLMNPAARRAVVSYIKSKCLKTSLINVAGVQTVKVTAEVPIFKVSYMLSSYAETPKTMMEKSMPGLDGADKAAEVDVIITNDRPMMAEKGAPQLGPFTSLIVDATGLKVERAMSPKIRRGDGSEVWGTVEIDPERVLDSGVVAYAKTMEDAAKNSRAGDNPLVITAIGRAGGRFYCDPVVTDDDAKLILSENDKDHFCDNLKVIFVVDGKM